MPGWVDSVSGVLFPLRSRAPGKSQGIGSVDCLTPEHEVLGVQLGDAGDCASFKCCCSVAAAVLTLCRAGYCSPCQRLLMLPWREDGRLSHSRFCSSAEHLHSYPRQHPHGQNGFSHAKSRQCRAEHCAPPNLHVLQVVYSFSKWKACCWSPDFCTTSVPQHSASPQHLPGCSVTVSASLNPSAGVDVETEVPGCPSTQVGQQQHSSTENTKHLLNGKNR